MLIWFYLLNEKVYHMYYYRIGAIYVLLECLNEDTDKWLMTIMAVPSISEEEWEKGKREVDWIVLEEAEFSKKIIKASKQLGLMKESARKKLKDLKSVSV